MIVHHLNDSRSQRVLWLLEELELPYEIVRYERDPRSLRAPRALRAVHPLGKSPVLTEDGRTLAESGAIIEYVLERHGNGRLIPPAGSDERLRYTHFLHYAEGSAMPLLLLKLVASRLAKAPTPALIRPVARLIARGLLQSFVEPELALHVAYLEGELARHTWFAGTELSAADIQMSFVVEALLARGDASTMPGLRAFRERVHQRPAYRRAEERGGALKLAREKA